MVSWSNYLQHAQPMHQQSGLPPPPLQQQTQHHQQQQQFQSQLPHDQQLQRYNGTELVMLYDYKVQDEVCGEWSK